jgi:regulation of enolase protein 1 (concanavalin A-like superfamily)
MRPLLAALAILATSPFAQTIPAQPAGLGLFTGSDDIGASPIKGAATFDPATSQYKITGSGTDIWARADQFHFLWREISGDFAVTATAKFLTEGIAHRKAVVMLRQSADADSAYVDLALHGDGTPVVQFRNTKGDTTNTVDLVTEGPGVWKLKLIRQGATVTFWAAKDSEPLRELGHTMTSLADPILLGLGVSSHSQAAVNTVLFSDVSIEKLPTPVRK